MPTTPGDPNVDPTRTTFDSQYLTTTFSTYSALAEYNWDLPTIRQVVSLHVNQGDFLLSSYLADYLLQDAAIFSALLQRISPFIGLKRELVRGFWADGAEQCQKAYDDAVEMFSDAGVCSPGFLADLDIDQAVSGVAIYQNILRPSADGRCLDLLEMRPWPLRAARYNQYLRRYQVQTTDGYVTIEHGDGKWSIVQPYRTECHRKGALRPLSECFADRRFGVRDRAQHSETHAIAKPIGTLPPEVKIRSDEGEAFRKQLQNLRLPRSGMIKPAGSSLETFEPKTLSFQVFENIINGNDGDIGKILLGQDTAASGKGGGNYMAARFLWGVRNDIIERDVTSAAQAINTGTLRPLAIMNYGDARAASSVRWPLPDPSEDQRYESTATRTAAYQKAIVGARASGFVVDQPAADKLAKEFGVDPMTLAPKPPIPDALVPFSGGDQPAKTDDNKHDPPPEEDDGEDDELDDDEEGGGDNDTSGQHPPIGGEGDSGPEPKTSQEEP